MLDELFFEDSWSFFVKAEEFLNAAYHLERIATQADEAWTREMSKSNLRPGVFECREFTPEMASITRDRSCRRISIYLFAHSIELQLKGLYLMKIGPLKERHHKVSELYKDLIEIMEPHAFNKKDLNSLLRKLDEVLLWAGRYSIPRENKHYNNAILAFAKTDLGITNDIAVTVNIALMKDFKSHIIGIIQKMRAIQNTKILSP